MNFLKIEFCKDYHLGKEGFGLALVGDMASNGDEFALLDLLFASESAFNCCECSLVVGIGAAAAASGDHWSLGGWISYWRRENEEGAAA